MRTHVASLALAAYLALGATPARAEVHPDGSFSHVIPIELPRAAGGGTPALALAYDSRGGDGVAGPGVTLSGLPVITRGAYTDAVRYAAGDTFYGPSGRLVPFTGGAYYHAATEDWGKYVPSGNCGVGPCSWTLYDKRGGTWTFGATTDSRIIPSDHFGSVRVWALNHFEDTSGNGYDVTYFTDGYTGAYYPQRITYGKGAGITQWRTVDFDYEPRPLHQPTYDQGTRVDIAKRLLTIRVASNGQAVRQLNLGYDTDGHFMRLGQLGSDLISTLPDQFFTWKPQVPFSVTRSALYNLSGFGPATWAGDFNGDGRVDAVMHDTASYWTHLKLSTAANGYAKLSLQTPPAHWGHDKSSGVGDFDGDGFDDLISVSPGGCGTCVGPPVEMYRGSQSGNLMWHELVPPGPKTINTDGYFWVGDFNGDGKSDFATRGNGTINVFYSTGTSFTSQTFAYGGAWGPAELTWVGDFDGDGRADLVTIGDNDLTVLRMVGTSVVARTSLHTGYDNDPKRTFAGDFNGDGKTDLLFVRTASGTDMHQLMYMLATGLDFDASSFTIKTAWGKQNIVGDFDGDRRADVLSLGVSGTASGFSSCVVHLWKGGTPFNRGSNNGTTTDDQVVLGGDTNGDGVTDALVLDPPAGTVQAVRPPIAFEALYAISNGLGGSTVLTYTPSGQVVGASTYNGVCAGVPSAEAWRCGNPDTRSRPIVTFERRHENSGSPPVDFSYSYWNARIFPGGPTTRADLGFESFTVYDHGTGLRDQHWFYQAKPFQHFERVHLVYKLDDIDNAPLNLMRVDNAQPMQRVCGEGGCTADPTIDTPAPRLLLPTSDTTVYSELGRPLYSVTRAFGFDGFGSPTSILESARDPAGNTLYAEVAITDYAYRFGIPRAVGVAYQARRCADTMCGDPIEWKRSYFDNASLGQLGTRLLPTRGESWISGATYAVTTRTFDVNGNVSTETAPNGVTTSSFYDEDPFRAGVTRVVNPADGEVRYHYDQRYDTPDQITWDNGRGESYDRDAFGRLVEKRVEKVSGIIGTRTTLERERVSYEWSTAGIAQTSCRLFRAAGDPAPAASWTGQLCTHTTFDGLGRKRAQAAPSGAGPTSVEWTYDGAGRETKVTEPHLAGGLDYFSMREYDAAARLSKVTLADGSVQSLSYNADTLAPGAVTVAAEIDGRGFRRIVHKDAHGRIVRVTEGNGQRCIDVPDPGPIGNARSVSSGTTTTTSAGTPDAVHCFPIAGATTKYSYDAHGRLATVTAPGGVVTTISYDVSGRRASVSDPSRGTTTWTYWDIAGDVRFGQVKTETRPDPNAPAGTVTSSYGYDAKGRLVTRSDSDGATLTQTWDESDVSYGTGRVTTRRTSAGGYDVIERLGYDARGVVTDVWRTVKRDDVTLASAHTVTDTDELGRPRAITNPDGSVLSYAYDATSGVVRSAALDGVTHVNWTGYSERNQPSQVDYANGIKNFVDYRGDNGLPRVTSTARGPNLILNNLYAFDGAHNVEKNYDILQQSLTTSYSYDSLDRLTRAVRQDGSTLTYSYSGDGNLVGKSGYDGAGNVVTRVRGFVAGTNRLADDGAGNVIGYGAGGAIRTIGATEYQYDAHQMLSVVKKDGQIVERLVYGAGGVRVLRIEYPAAGVEIRTFTLGAAQEVSERVVAGLVVQRFSTRIVPGTSGHRAAEVTVAQPVIGPAGAAAPATIGLSRPTAFGLLAFALAGLAWLGVDGRRRRGTRVTALVSRRPAFARLVPLLLYGFVAQGCGGQGYGVQATPLGTDPDVPLIGTRYYSGDHLGSTALVTDASGAETLRLKYAPYGEADPAHSGRFDGTSYDTSVQMPAVGFTGQRFDRAVGLYDYHARQYDPGLGIFLTPDSAVADPTMSGDLNPYLYVRGNPLRYTDPSGHFAVLVPLLFAAGGFIVGGTHGHLFSADAWSHFSWRDAAIGAAIGLGIGVCWAGAGMVGGSFLGTPTAAIFQAGITNGAISTTLAYSEGQHDPLKLAAIFGISFLSAAAGEVMYSGGVLQNLGARAVRAASDSAVESLSAGHLVLDLQVLRYERLRNPMTGKMEGGIDMDVSAAASMLASWGLEAGLARGASYGDPNKKFEDLYNDERGHFVRAANLYVLSTTVDALVTTGAYHWIAAHNGGDPNGEAAMLEKMAFGVLYSVARMSVAQAVTPGIAADPVAPPSDPFSCDYDDCGFI